MLNTQTGLPSPKIERRHTGGPQFSAPATSPETKAASRNPPETPCSFLPELDHRPLCLLNRVDRCRCALFSAFSPFLSHVPLRTSCAVAKNNLLIILGVPYSSRFLESSPLSPFLFISYIHLIYEVYSLLDKLPFESHHSRSPPINLCYPPPIFYPRLHDMGLVTQLYQRFPSKTKMPSIEDFSKTRLSPRLAFLRRRIRLKGNSSISVPLGIVLLFPVTVILLILVLFIRHPDSPARILIPSGSPPSIR